MRRRVVVVVVVVAMDANLGEYANIGSEWARYTKSHSHHELPW